MTLKKALVEFDSLYRNNIPSEIKIEWLSFLDLTVYKEVLLSHENPPQSHALPYTADTPEDTPLLVEDPYSELYIKFLSMKKDLYYSDIARYNNDVILYSASYEDFKNYYNKTHKPIKNISFFNA